ncbi:hypothetical protein ALC53_12880 [Atta colombica]|uniref:Uncharacterized protein n=1 Tax=Atta colombica TaxID=520822 RepID=A0A151HYQ1_9HYME|nr:hypothetical protein ALC53_12880 [Atta colombica]
MESHRSISCGNYEFVSKIFIGISKSNPSLFLIFMVARQMVMGPSLDRRVPLVHPHQHPNP